MNSIKNIANECIQTLNELSDKVLNINSNDYALKRELLEGNTFGMHVRHVIEFFKALLNGKELGEVHYDKRSRNPHLELDTKEAQSALLEIISVLSNIETDGRLLVNFNSNEDFLITSTISRELAYNLEHCVHHMAILRICILQEIKYLKLSDSFGVASSTLKYRKENHVHSKLSSQ